mgnify:CR=1 FL=1
MSDMGDTFNAMKEATKEHRAKMLAKADTTGWTKHTDWHYSRMFKGKRVDWWPSGGKAMHDGKMVYGHRKVEILLAKLMGVGYCQCSLRTKLVGDGCQYCNPKGFAK